MLALLALFVLAGVAWAQDRQIDDYQIGFNLDVRPQSPLYMPGQVVEHRWLISPPSSGEPVLTEIYFLLRYPKSLRVLDFHQVGQGHDLEFVCRDDLQWVTCIASSVRALNVFYVRFEANESAEVIMDLGVVGAPRYRIRKPVEVMRSQVWLPVVTR